MQVHLGQRVALTWLLPRWPRPRWDRRPRASGLEPRARGPRSPTPGRTSTRRSAMQALRRLVRREMPPTHDAAQPLDAGRPADAAVPLDTGPADAAQPLDTGRPADAAQPLDTGRPADAAQPLDTGRPADAAQPLDTSRPADAAQPLDTGRPADAAQPLDAAPAGETPFRCARSHGLTPRPGRAPTMTSRTAGCSERSSRCMQDVQSIRGHHAAEPRVRCSLARPTKVSAAAGS
jgi:hypothetical protein